MEEFGGVGEWAKFNRLSWSRNGLPRVREALNLLVGRREQTSGEGEIKVTKG